MPTFGNTNIEDELSFDLTEAVYGSKFSLTEQGTIQTIHLYLYTAAGNLRLAIYNDNAGAPNELQCETNSEAASTGWNELTPTTTPTLSAGTYWICLQVDSSTSHLGEGSGDTNQTYGDNHTYGTFPDPATPDDYWDVVLSIYATYSVPTAEGGYTAIF